MNQQLESKEKIADGNWIEGSKHKHKASCGDGSIKSWHHSEMDAEVVVYEQHRGMKMEYDVMLVRNSELKEVNWGQHREWNDSKKISSGHSSSSKAEEKAKDWMKNFKYAGREGEIICEDCGIKVSRVNSGSKIITCHECDNFVVSESKEDLDDFKVIGS